MELMNSFHGKLRIAQLWRKITVVLMVALLSAAPGFAQLKIEKLNLPQGVDNYGGGERYPYHNVMYNFSENSIKPVIYSESGNKIECTIWEIDFSRIYRQFTITAPQGFRDVNVQNLGDIAGIFADGEASMTFTQDLFNDDDLIEIVLACRDGDNKDVVLIMNERGEVLAESDDDVRFTILDPALTGGLIITENGYIVRKDSSSINEMSLDRHEGTVSPNPSRGANPITISWGYTLLTDGRLNVISIDGKLVHSQTVKAGTSELNLAVSHLAAGTYVYVVESDNGYTTTGKFIID